MKYKVNFEGGKASLPTAALNIIDRAGADELKVLLCLCAAGGDADVKTLARLSCLAEDEVRDALAFLRGAGLVESAKDKKATGKKGANAEKPSAAETLQKPVEKKLEREAALPNYTSAELGNLLEKREDVILLVNEGQNVLGKTFNYKEVGVLVGLLDYLELDNEYVLTLMSYCASLGKRSLHYIEKMAFSFYDAGVCTTEQLEAELDRRERLQSMEGKIRSLFGLGARALTTKEKKFISAWVSDFGYGEDIIKKAYEVTADATGNASIPYANSVLERWNAAGYKTLSEIEESYQKNKAEKPHEGSFDTDDFFEAAVRRALGDN